MAAHSVAAVTTRGQAPVVLVRQPGGVPLRLLLGGPAVEVGRDCSGLVLTDPKVSRRHLSLRAADGAVRVTDLGSRNGTFVDGERLRGPHVLSRGEQVQLGRSTISLCDPRLPVEQARAAVAATSIELVTSSVLADPPDYAALPGNTRTLTVVFSDLEGADRVAGELGAHRWRAALVTHAAIVRRQVLRHGGLELRAHRDGFMLVFPSAHRALSFGAALHRARHAVARSRPAETPRARAGAHTAELLVGAGGDLFAPHVALASRVAGAARGGELLVTGLVRELVEPRGDIEFGPPRLVTLKDLGCDHLVHPVQWTRRADLSSPPAAAHGSSTTTERSPS